MINCIFFFIIGAMCCLVCLIVFPKPFNFIQFLYINDPLADINAKLDKILKKIV